MPPVAEWIRVLGAQERNLNDVDVEIPKRRVTAVTGVSGSGKSSLVFDTIAVEGQRQLNETLPAFVRSFMPSSARPAVDMIDHLPATIAVDQRPLTGGARSTIGTVTDIAPLLRLLFSRAGDPFVGFADAFSFNMPAGMCPVCEGTGEVVEVNMATFLDTSKSLRDGALQPPPFKVGSRDYHLLAGSGRLDPDKPIALYTEKELDDLLHATGGTVVADIAGSEVKLSYEGALVKFRRRYLGADGEPGKRTKQMIEEFTSSVPCSACGGSRLSPLALDSKIDGYNIAELSSMECVDLLEILRAFDLPKVAPILDALTRQIGHLVDIGLGYLSLDRRTATLSGGESQRVKIVRHLSSSLNDMLYVFDEPSIGLHPGDVHRLTRLLHVLRDKGNTVLVVEHDRDVIAAADHVIDIGPGAGNRGGRVMYSGPAVDLATSGTLTGQHMTAGTSLKTSVRSSTGALRVVDARTHNLRDITVDLPTGVLTAIAGVAGAGKSSLVNGALRTQHPQAVLIDQSPPHVNRRSAIVTATGAANAIRSEFAKANRVDAALFSPNSSGACPTCSGLGEVFTDLASLAEISQICQTCDGKRFSDEVLEYRLRGRTISDVLEMPVEEGLGFFAKTSQVSSVLTSLADVGLGYLRLGQSTTSLSGGECQRMKLAARLHTRSAVYILDEPTTGLHMADVGRLLEVLDRLVDDYGATVVVIEHNLDVIAHCDWVIELGPEGGSRGGRLLFEGPPSQLVSAKSSPTGKHLSQALVNTGGQGR